MRTIASKKKTTSAYPKKIGALKVALFVVAASITASCSPGLLQLGKAYADDGNGLVIPMYGWESGFDDVIAAKEDNPGTEMIVIVNPSNGAGASEDSHWSEIVDDLQDADIKVVGYVSTAYASRSQDDIQQEVENYDSWYGVDGIFFDEVSPSALDYYQDLHDIVEEYSDLVILNPGAPVPEEYEQVADIIIAYENYGIPSEVTSNGISEEKLGALPYGLEPSEDDFKELSDEVGYLYVAPDWINLASNIDDQADWAD